MTQTKFIVLCMYCMSVYPGIMHENITVVDDSVCKNDVDVHVYVFKKKSIFNDSIRVFFTEHWNTYDCRKQLIKK